MLLAVACDRGPSTWLRGRQGAAASFGLGRRTGRVGKLIVRRGHTARKHGSLAIHVGLGTLSLVSARGHQRIEV